jgi:uncharacterized protein YndB with AHSA1/START domain
VSYQPFFSKPLPTTLTGGQEKHLTTLSGHSIQIRYVIKDIADLYQPSTFISMNKKHGTFPEPGTIRFERLLPGPPERIWDYLTKSELKAKWLSAGGVEPRVGGKVEFKFKHSNLSDVDKPIPEKYKHMQDGTYFEGRVTAWDPPRLLRYTWGEDTGEESEVTYELIPKPNNKVLLILTHVRLGDDPSVMISVGAGWHTHLGILEDRLHGNPPKGFWEVHARYEREYSERLSRN